MDVLLYGVLALMFAVPVVGIVRTLWKSGEEQSPEREPDVSDEERAWLGMYFKTNKWEERRG